MGITTYSYNLYCDDCINDPQPINHDALLDEISDKEKGIVGLKCPNCKKKWKIIEINELNKLRDDLYNELPSGNVDAFELIKIIKKHINKLDEIIN